jgi:hypothetical protein
MTMNLRNEKKTMSLTLKNLKSLISMSSMKTIGSWTSLMSESWMTMNLNETSWMTMLLTNLMNLNLI